jgi:hypothetical protein
MLVDGRLIGAVLIDPYRTLVKFEVVGRLRPHDLVYELVASRASDWICQALLAWGVRRLCCARGFGRWTAGFVSQWFAPSVLRWRAPWRPPTKGGIRPRSAGRPRASTRAASNPTREARRRFPPLRHKIKKAPRGPILFLGGEGGIRTHGTVTRTPDFESGTFDHSATSPLLVAGRLREARL